MTFRADQIALLVHSGWSQCSSVAAAVQAAGLPALTSRYLATALSAEQWRAAEQAASALRDHFKASRFADEVSYGVVLVPDPAQLDTRRPMDPKVRKDQLGKPAPTCSTSAFQRGAAACHRDAPGRWW
jgi:hypothetical protein